MTHNLFVVFGEPDIKIHELEDAMLKVEIDVDVDGVDVRLRVDGLASVFSDLVERRQRAA